VACEQDVELLPIKRRERIVGYRGRGTHAVKADLALDAIHRQLPGGCGLDEDPGELAGERGEVVALAGGPASLLVDATSCAAVGVAQLLVEEIQQPVAALEIQLGEHGEDQRVPPRGLQAPDRLRRHPRPRCDELAPARRRQRREIDPVRVKLQQPAVAPDLSAQLGDADASGALLQQRELAATSHRGNQEPVELRAPLGRELVCERGLDARVRRGSCRGDEAQQPIESRTDDLACVEMFGRKREQHAGGVVFDGAFAEPRLERGCGRAVESLVAEVLAYAREMIDPGPGPRAVLEQLMRGRVDLTREKFQRCRGQAREVLRHEAEEPQRAQLDRQTEAVRSSALREHQLAIGVRQREARAEVLDGDLLGEALKPAALRVTGIGHARSLGSEVDLQVVDGLLAVSLAGQAVAPRRLHTRMAGEFGDGHEVGAAAHQSGQARVAQHMRRELEARHARALAYDRVRRA
jgi:hypothetical protein